MLTPDPQQRRTIEHRELTQTIAKTETQIAALRRFAALPPETVAAVKEEASAMGRRAYDTLECNAARVADALQHGVDRAKSDADAADWQVIRKAHDRLNRVIAQQPLSDACHWLGLHTPVELPVGHLGFGAMRITGQGIWGPPKDESEAIALLRRVVDRGVTFIDTADFYGPGIREAVLLGALSLSGRAGGEKGGLTTRCRPLGRRLSARGNFAPRLCGQPEKAEARAHRALPATCGRSPDIDRGFERRSSTSSATGRSAISACRMFGVTYSTSLFAKLRSAQRRRPGPEAATG